MPAVLFFVGTALVALHVADDRFVQPEPGTGPADHLVSGLVPLALLALAAWGYRRARPGIQGMLALAMAIAAALSGVEAIVALGRDGLAGDDVTGLLALAAAPALLVSGVWSLWTSRRLDDSRARRYSRRTLKGVAAVVVLWTVALPVGAAYVTAHVARAPVPESEANLGAPHEHVTLRTRDGLDLDAWYVPSRNRAAVIVFPGKAETRGHARMLTRHGYGVLVLDRRGEGRSDGDPDGWGWNFDEDIRAGLRFLRDRPDVDPAKVGGLGLSVGGEMMLQTAAETPDLAAVVSEGAGSRTVGEELDDVSGPDSVTIAINYGLRDLANAILQDTLPPPNLMTLIPQIAPRPVFLIHAGDDDVGRRNPDYFAAAGQPKQIWEAQGGHTDGLERQPREYERRVVGFFDRALQPER